MKRECIKTLFSQKMRVRHNAQIERFPPATVICSRGGFSQKRSFDTLKYFRSCLNFLQEELSRKAEQNLNRF